MSDNKKEKRSSLDKRIVLFFVFAVLCVAAFLIVILVKSCEAEHEEGVEESELLEEGLGYNISTETSFILNS